MAENQINKLIDSLHFRSFNKLVDEIKKHYPNMKKSDIKRIIDNRWHDTLRKNKMYMVKIFSARPGTWMMDLMDNTTKCKDIRYWCVFININTRYAVAYTLDSKKGAEIRQVLTQFINKYKPNKIVCDDEGGVSAEQTLKLLRDKNVILHTVKEQNHTTLSIIDRFIRTLRDMNTPGSGESHDEKYTYLTEPRMNKLLNVYNNTYHSSIKCTPQEMQNNPNLEKEYIFKMLEKRDKQQGISDMNLKKGWYVQYLIPKQHMKKRRYYSSRECYQIAAIKGNIYTIMAKDGSVRNLPRWRIILCNKDGSKPNNMKFGSTFPGKWNGLIDEIVAYNTRTKKYRVIFAMPNNQRGYADVLPESYVECDKNNVPHVNDDDKEWLRNNR